MARLFNGTDQSLQSASAIDLSTYNKISIVFWLWWDAFANDDKFAGEFSDNYNSNDAFLMDPDAPLGSAWSLFMHSVTGAVYNGGYFPRPSAGAWHQYVLLLDRTTGTALGVTVYLDGALQTVTQTESGSQTGNFGSYTLNLMSRNNASLFGAGRMAELAIYGGILLSQTEATSLQTLCPNSVNTPTHYWPLDGTTSPEPASVGGVNLTVNGATQAPHPITCALRQRPLTGVGLSLRGLVGVRVLDRLLRNERLTRRQVLELPE